MTRLGLSGEKQGQLDFLALQVGGAAGGEDRQLCALNNKVLIPSRKLATCGPLFYSFFLFLTLAGCCLGKKKFDKN